MNRATVIRTAQQYARIVEKELKPVAILLYGSYAKDAAGTDSDIDIAVIFNGFNGNWLETSSYLWKLRRGISDDIEPILLDLAQDPSGFAADIFNTGEILYSAG